MARVAINGSELGNALSEMLMWPDMEPGDSPSYELCKIIWAYHPLGAKMVEAPITMAQCQEREISVPDAPEDMVRDAFMRAWRSIGADDIIYNVMATSRAYGIAAVAIKVDGAPDDKPIDLKALYKQQVSFSTFDPLNTAGSLVLNQDPNAFDFQRPQAVAVSGVPYHRSRTVVMMNEKPIYILWTSSAYGFSGRSVFQRALFPLKSFVQTMVTDDLITKKAGVFIAMLSVAGAIVDAVMEGTATLKRLFVKEATNGNVISIGEKEKIETLNMQNIDGAYGMARANILKNCAVAADMPALILEEETFAEGFGEGTEDAKRVARWVDRFRRKMDPLYEFFDVIVMHLAWNPEFYKTVQAEHDEWRSVPYEQAFTQWRRGFAAKWPSLLTEPDSEKVKTEKVRLEGLVSFVELMLAGPLPQQAKAQAIAWMQDNVNENKMMFKNPLLLDIDAIAGFEPPLPTAPGAEDGDSEPAPKPKGLTSADSGPAVADVRARRRADQATNRALADILARLPNAIAQHDRSHLNGKSNGHAK
jgi:hypothetical protein